MPAIIFDFDGVIVDSEPMHEAALREALRAEGMDFSAQDYREKYLGFDDRDICIRVAKAHDRTLSDSDLARLMRLKCVKTQDAIGRGDAKPFPGSVDLLKAACAAGPVAICSGARREEIDAVLRWLGVAGLVKIIVSADDVAKSKPDPASYRLVTERLGLPAPTCVTIEDTAFGMRSAKGAGVRVVAVCHSMTPPELAGADLVVGSVAELTVPRLLALATVSARQ